MGDKETVGKPWKLTPVGEIVLEEYARRTPVRVEEILIMTRDQTVANTQERMGVAAVLDLLKNEHPEQASMLKRLLAAQRLLVDALESVRGGEISQSGKARAALAAALLEGVDTTIAVAKKQDLP